MTISSEKDFAVKVMFPIIDHYLLKLDSYLRQRSGKEHRVFFVLRAGYRIFKLYKEWCRANNLSLQDNLELIKMSRLVACKLAYKKNKSIAIDMIGKEFEYSSLSETLSAISGGIIKLNDKNLNIPLHEFFGRNINDSVVADKYLLAESEMIERYLGKLIGGAKKVTLIDSGWQGTQQYLIQLSIPKVKFDGLYFGAVKNEKYSIVNENIRGLIFSNNGYDGSKPETCLTYHRHLIESFFEPNISTCNHITEADIGAKIDIDGFTEEYIDFDRIYMLVYDKLKRSPSSGFLKNLMAYKVAVDMLNELICFPKRSQLHFLQGKNRSCDFGRTKTVPPLLTKNHFISIEERLKNSLWIQGQLALEYSDAFQQQLTYINSSIKNEKTKHSEHDLGSSKNLGNVAIITRTKDRPILLARAAESIAKQTYDNYTWVVVNDGGNIDDVLEVISTSQISPEKILLFSNEKSLGMEAASNVGIKNSESEFIVIHDDDDSWHPDFLQETVTFLAENETIYKGVISKTTRIDEVIVDNNIKILSKSPYNSWAINVQLSEMAVCNFFPPIAFVFRRHACEDVGFFDEELPVLGDWDFNIRFLLKYDIGVLEKELAFYHIRNDHSVQTDYSNSITAGVNKHGRYNAILRNKYIRKARNNTEYMVIAMLMGSNVLQEDTRYRIDNLKSAIKEAPSFSSKYPSYAKLEKRLSELEGKYKKKNIEADYLWSIVYFLFCQNTNSSVSIDNYHTFLPVLEEEMLEFAKISKIPPPPDFDENQYILNYKDVKMALQEGKIIGVFNHYLINGIKEGRSKE